MYHLYEQFASYLRRVLAKTRLIFSRINGPIVSCVSQEIWPLKVIVMKKNLVLLLVLCLTVYNIHFFLAKMVARTALKIEMHVSFRGILSFSSFGSG